MAVQSDCKADESVWRPWSQAVFPLAHERSHLSGGELGEENNRRHCCLQEVWRGNGRRYLRCHAFAFCFCFCFTAGDFKKDNRRLGLLAVLGFSFWPSAVYLFGCHDRFRDTPDLRRKQLFMCLLMSQAVRGNVYGNASEWEFGRFWPGLGLGFGQDRRAVWVWDNVHKYRIIYLLRLRADLLT